MADLPLACTLSAAELSERRAVLAALQAHCHEVRPLAEGRGLALRFEPAPGLLATIARVIDLERQCCLFLDFQLEVAADAGPISLTLAGPAGTSEFLTHELGLAPTAPGLSA
jgi:hypothetical protein